MRIALGVSLLAVLACSCRAQSGNRMAQIEKKDVLSFENQLEGAVRPGEITLQAKLSNGKPTVGVLVTYRASASSGATCQVRIFDVSNDKAVEVANSSELVDCADVPTAKVGMPQVALGVEVSRVSITQTQSDNSAAFELRRSSRGWVVEGATYTRPEVDDHSGDVLVVQESVMYPEEAAPSMADYSYDRVKPDLARKVVE